MVAGRIPKKRVTIDQKVQLRLRHSKRGVATMQRKQRTTRSSRQIGCRVALEIYNQKSYSDKSVAPTAKLPILACVSGASNVSQRVYKMKQTKQTK